MGLRQKIQSAKLQTLILMGTFALVVAMALTVSGISVSREEAVLRQLFDQQLTSTTRSAKIQLEEHFKGMRNDLVMLGGIPPIAGYIRTLHNGGIDPVRGETTDEWLDRLSTIFEALIRSHEDYTQIRLIGIADGGREIARVDQRNGTIARTPAADLQRKANNDYFRETITLRAGQFHVSPITLNREHDQIEMPPRPMVRVATPVISKDGELIGILVINAEFWQWTQALLAKYHGDLQGYVLNPDLDFLSHPDPQKTFGFDFGHPYRLSDEFPDLDVQALGKGDTALPIQALREQRVAAARVNINPGEQHDDLIVLFEFPYSHIQPMIDASRRSSLILISTAAGVIMLFIGWVVRNALHPLQQLKAAAEAITLGRYDTALPEVQGAELLALRSAFEAMKSAVLQREMELRDHRDTLAHRVMVATIEVEAIVRSAPSGIVTIDERGLVRNFNPAAEKLFGWTAEDIVGQNVAVLLEGAQIRAPDGTLGPLALETDWLDLRPDWEILIRRKNGEPFEAYLALGHTEISAMRHFYVAFVSDITDRKQREEELRLTRDVAEKATQAKSDFLANMSHEIRTPMNAILGLCYLLEQQNLAPVASTMIHKIHEAGRSLLGVINDILDFSKIEAHRLDVESIPFRLSDTLDNLAGIMSSAVGSKQIEVLVSPSPRGAEFLKGDPLRLGQVLINLTSNAIKFTQQGEVALEITHSKHAPQDERNVRLRFAVRDTGIGIPKDKQDSIFQAFSQADSTTTRSFGGTGLGLSISRRLVELMGGSLQVHSEPGKGSEFFFELEFENSNPLHSSSPQMLHQTILIADDQETARAMLANTAASMGWQVEVVESGDKVLEAVQADTATPYDILLLDWRMPGLDGLSTARKVRQIHQGPTELPIIIMATAFDRERLMEQPGVDAVDVVISKPVTGSSLYNAVQEAKIRRGLLPGDLIASDTPRRLIGVDILVVDDSEINREVAKRILESEGADVTLADDGHMALAVLQERNTLFDAILMDVQMPVMDGYAATRHIRAMPRLAHVPIIALTAGAFKVHREAAYAAGMDSFVAKPFDVDELITVVGRLVKPRLVPPSDASPEPGQPVGAPAVPAIAMDIDVRRGMMLWKDETVFRKYLRGFIREYSGTMTALDGMEDDDIARLAHKIKGTAGNLALPRVAREAEGLERAILDQGNRVEASHRLQWAVDAARLAIKTYAGEDEPAATMKDGPAEEYDLPLLSRLLGYALAACRRDSPDVVEPTLDALAPHLSAAQLAPIRHCVDDFDFRGAEAAIKALLSALERQEKDRTGPSSTISGPDRYPTH
ncbi:response regulator [Insolitispirillum peregrinum]|uniref:response regulator n=1 Tax=Insolitispirillum peregrinum TaxID=80876 RepID=UPI003622A5B5